MKANTHAKSLDGKLIRLSDAFQALDDSDEIRGTAYLQMEEALEAIPVVAILHDCVGCLGASFGDCEDCDAIMDLRKEAEG